MTAQHTPGPWHVANDVQIRSEKHQIAKVWMMRNGEGNANARLIAAAPDLLEALQMLADVDFGACEWRGEAEIAAIKARAAISKATGEIT